MDENVWNPDAGLIPEIREFVLHSFCVSRLAGLVSGEMGFPEHFQKDLQLAGLLHDIGKGMSGELELQDGDTEKISKRMNIDTLRYTRAHPSLGYMILQEEGYSNFIANAVLYHHENYDGTGFPSNLQGKEIPIAARILRVCDTYAALITNRPYRKAFDPATAMELTREDVKYFDMKVFLAFLSVMQEQDNQKEIQTISRSEGSLREIAEERNIELKEIKLLWQNLCKD